VPVKKKRSNRAGAGGFLLLLFGALFWKLGVFGGEGGPFATEGGADSRRSAVGEKPETDSRAVEAAAPSRPAKAFIVTATVITRDEPPRPQRGRKVALLRPLASTTVAEAVTGADGVARLVAHGGAESAFDAGELAARLADRVGAGDVETRVDPSRARTVDGVRTVEVVLADDPPAVEEPRTPGGAAAAGGATEGAAGRAASREAKGGADDPPLAEGPAEIGGRLLYRDGKPAAHSKFELHVYRGRGRARGVAGADVITGAAGDDGRFALTTEAGRDVLVELRTGPGATDDVAPFLARAATLDSATPLSFGDVRLSRRASLVSGRVADLSGRAVPGASVALRPIPTGLELRAFADAYGRFEIRGPEEIARFELFAETEESAGRTPRPLERGATDVFLVVAAASTVEGAVAAPDPSVLSLVDLVLETESGARAATAKPRRDGSFRFLHVAAGRYRVIASTAGVDDETADGVVAATGASTSDPRLAALKVATSYVARRIKVVDDRGAPIADATVSAAVKGASTPMTVRTAKDGVAKLFAPSGKKLVLHVSRQGLRSRELDSDGAADLQVTLHRE
jgi:hypothetical protein